MKFSSFFFTLITLGVIYPLSTLHATTPPCTPTECRIQGDEIAAALFDTDADSPWRGALEEMRAFDAVFSSDHTPYNAEERDETDSEYDTEDTLRATAHISWNHLSDLQGELRADEAEKARAIWQQFVDIIPLSWRNELRTLEVQSGSDNAAYIDAANNTGAFWMRLLMPSVYTTLGIDIESFGEDSLFDTLTLIHEFAHLASLAPDQYGYEFFCWLPFTYECFAPESYLNQFFYRFWSDFEAEWIDKYDKTEAENAEFFELYRDEFLNSYASGNPHEDFAESFTAFIVTPSNALDAEYRVDQKILFFYEFDELVTLRYEILQNLETAVQSLSSVYYDFQ